MKEKLCCIRDCEKKERASGFCNHHYMQWHRYGHPLADVLPFQRTGHRARNSATYNCWVAMKKRCTDSKASGWKNYGGRGIKVCDRWLVRFANFLEDMGECPEGLSLERIDNNGNYEPSNCKWATQIEQSQNKRGILLTENKVLSARQLYYSGVRTIAQLAEDFCIPYSTMYQAVKGRSWRHLDA